MESKKRNLNIDLLKGLAIIAVVFYHLGWSTYGYLGVDVFFVIGGYYLFKSMLKSYKNNSFSYFQYLLGKVVRLWPLVLLAGLVSLVVGYFTMLPNDYLNLSKSVIASNIFGNNIFECRVTRNYWDIINIYKPLMHLWYVGVLMQFYIVAPIFFAITYRFTKNKKKSTTALLIVFVAISFVLYMSPQIPAEQKFYYLPYRFFELGTGGLLAMSFAEKINNSKFSKPLCFYISVVIITIMMFANVDLIDAHIRLTLIVLVSIVYVRFSFTNQNIYGQVPLFCNVIAKIGRASYSIFIWHQVVFAFYRYCVNAEPYGWDYGYIFAIAILLSWLSYYFIEKKLNLKDNRTCNTVLVCSLAIFILTTTTSLALYHNTGVVRDVPELNVYKSNDNTFTHETYVDRIYKYAKEFSCKQSGKRKVLAIGDSFARDFLNILLESNYSDSLEIRYIYNINDRDSNYVQRIKDADVIFERGIIELNGGIPKHYKNLMKSKKVYGIGVKGFGYSNGVVYNRRFESDYFESRVTVPETVRDFYQQEKLIWKDHYVDFIAPLVDKNWMVPVFTPEHKFISPDCRHLSPYGAKFYAKILDLSKYLK